ncbi:substrate-binding domain-containing protein [Thermodesulfobacteriota bacterium]
MEKRFGLVGGMVSILVLVCLVAAPLASDHGKKIVRVVGAGAAAEIIDQYAKDFMKDNPQVTIVVQGGSTTSGLGALMSGDAEVVMASRKIRPAELSSAGSKGKKLEEAIFAVADVPLVTHPNNPVETLDMDQLRRIMGGQIKNWNQVGGPDLPITVIIVDPKSPTGKDFYSSIFIDRNKLQGQTLSKDAPVEDSFLLAVSKVASTPGAVGFCRIADLRRLERAKNLKAVKLIALKPDESGRDYNPQRTAFKADITKVHAGDRSKDPYEIDRGLFLYYDASNQDALAGQQFVEYCVRKLGSKVVIKCAALEFGRPPLLM